MKWFVRLCLCGLIANLIAWCLPNSIQPYHVHHWMDEWKVAIVQHKSEYGMAPNGIVYGRFSREYFAGTPQLISQLRQDWYTNIKNSKTRWPIDSKRILYDEWGPSHLIRPDGIEVLEVGQIYSVPYSLGVLVCGVPLIAWLICHLHKRRVVGIVAEVDPTPQVTG